MSQLREMPGDDNLNMKIEAVQALVNMVERYLDLLEKNEQRMNNLIELIFKNMLELENQVEPEWASPPDGFNDDCLEDDD